MSDQNPTLSIIPLNMNEIDISNRRQRVWDCLKKEYATLCFLQEIHLKFKVTNWRKKRFHANTNHGLAGVAILLLDKRSSKIYVILRNVTNK